MRHRFVSFVVTFGNALLATALHAAPVSVTSLDYTPGALGTPNTGLNTAAYRATTDAKFQDFPRNTGGSINARFARGLSNNSFAASTILPIGPNGGATFKFQEPIRALANAKEFVIHNGTFLTSGGGFFYGDMKAAILVSNDNIEWRTLDGSIVADPSTYTATIYNMNAPTMSYVWESGKVAWDYCTGSGKPQSILDTLPLANFESPMPDDSIFNDPASTNAQRAALRTSTLGTDYASIFGNTAGGNWFDISATGLAQIQYLRVNVAANAPAIVRLDSIFANALAVPEPGTIVIAALAAVGFVLFARKRR